MIIILILAAALIVYFVVRKNDSTSDYTESAPALDIDAIEALNKKYRPILDEHTKLLEKIGSQYTVARELGGYEGADMDKVIELCEKDMALAEHVIEFDRLYNEIRGITHEPPMPYQSFKRLSIIYEKRGDYERAAMACKRALDLGITRDGTEGGMLGRFARLSKKYMKQQEQ